MPRSGKFTTCDLHSIDRSPRSRIHTSEGHRSQKTTGKFITELWPERCWKTMIHRSIPKINHGVFLWFLPKKTSFFKQFWESEVVFLTIQKPFEKTADLPALTRLTACWLLLTRLTCLVFLRGSGWRIFLSWETLMAYNPSKWWFSRYIPSGND